MSRLRCAVIYARQKYELGVSRRIIDRRIVEALFFQNVGPLLFAQDAGHVDVLGPAARLSLVEEQIIRDPHRFDTAIPFRLLPESIRPTNYRFGLRAITSRELNDEHN